ncbi:MAG: PoNe immunity protein domain-containing protein, partial [Moheibacter sp.]
MRTNIKTKEHFDSYINLNYEDIDYYLDSIEVGRVKSDRISAVKRQIFTTSLHTIISKYSAGYPVSELQAEFPQVITYFEEGWKDKKTTSTDTISFDDYVLV